MDGWMNRAIYLSVFIIGKSNRHEYLKVDWGDFLVLFKDVVVVNVPHRLLLYNRDFNHLTYTLELKKTN